MILQDIVDRLNAQCAALEDRAKLLRDITEIDDLDQDLPAAFVLRSSDTVSPQEGVGALVTQQRIRQFAVVLMTAPVTGIASRRNLLVGTDTLATQSVTVTAVAHTLSFTGTGTVTLSGASTAGPLVGTGAANRVSLTFTPSAAALTLTVSGSVTLAQLEIGDEATAYQRVGALDGDNEPMEALRTQVHAALIDWDASGFQIEYAGGEARPPVAGIDRWQDRYQYTDYLRYQR
jgi:hypothetical protein